MYGCSCNHYILKTSLFYCLSKLSTSKCPVSLSRIMIGIDLGTTASAAAIADGGSARMLADSEGRAVMPSLVGIREDGQFFVGHEAAAEARKYSGKNLTIGSLKRTMDRTKEFRWAGVQSAPQILTALILAELRLHAEKCIGEEVNRAVIAVPANFGFFQRQFTREAARA